MTLKMLTLHGPKVLLEYPKSKDKHLLIILFTFFF